MMKIIISEDQDNSLFVKRRLGQVQRLVKHQDVYEEPCIARDFSMFLDILITEIRDYFTLNWINDENFRYVEFFVRTQMRIELKNHYYKKCGKL